MEHLWRSHWTSMKTQTKSVNGPPFRKRIETMSSQSNSRLLSHILPSSWFQSRAPRDETLALLKPGSLGAHGVDTDSAVGCPAVASRLVRRPENSFTIALFQVRLFGWAIFRDLNAAIVRMATLLPSGRISLDLVREEMERLSSASGKIGGQ
jgi:hypothetical protein